MSTERDLADALTLAKAGKYVEASQRLFQLSYSPRYRDRRMQIKYILGMTLHQLKLNQTSAFQFIGVVKEGNNKYIKQSLERLSLAADALGDDTLLNYAISRVNVDEFPRAHRDMLHFRIGEYQMRNRQFEEASRSFDRVAKGHNLYSAARYNQGGPRRSRTNGPRLGRVRRVDSEPEWRFHHRQVPRSWNDGQGANSLSTQSLGRSDRNVSRNSAGLRILA